MHEIMVSEEEATRCVKRGDYYAIRRCSLNCWRGRTRTNALNKEFSSADTVLDLSGTSALLKKHGLMVEDVDLHNSDELLR